MILAVGTAVTVTPFANAKTGRTRRPYDATIIGNANASWRGDGWYTVRDAAGRQYDALARIVTAR